VLLLSSCCKRFEMDLKNDSWVGGCEGAANDEVAVARVELLDAVAEVLSSAGALLITDITGTVALGTETDGDVVPSAGATLELWEAGTTEMCDELGALFSMSDAVV